MKTTEASMMTKEITLLQLKTMYNTVMKYQIDWEKELSEKL